MDLARWHCVLFENCVYHEEYAQRWQISIFFFFFIEKKMLETKHFKMDYRSLSVPAKVFALEAIWTFYLKLEKVTGPNPKLSYYMYFLYIFSKTFGPICQSAESIVHHIALAPPRNTDATVPVWIKIAHRFMINWLFKKHFKIWSTFIHFINFAIILNFYS